MSQPVRSAGAGELILLVDDSATQALIGRLALEAAGFEVAVCDSGMALFEYVKCGHPDLILLDMYLPGISGQEVAAELKSSPAFATIPILFLTGTSDPNDIVSGLSIGARGYLVKPVDGAVLVAHIQAILRDTRKERELGSLVRRLLTMVTLVAGRLGGLRDPETLLGQLTRLIQQDFGYACVRIWLAEGDQLRLTATSGATADQPLPVGSVHSLAESGHVVQCFVQDVPTSAADPELKEAESLADGAPRRVSLQAVPLHLEGQAYGVLEICSGKKTLIGIDDQLVNQALADLVSVAAHDARM